MMKLSGGCAVAITVLLSSLGPALAEDNTKTSSQSAPPPVKGQVTKTALPAEVGLKDLGDAAKHLRKAALYMVGELTRQDLVVVGEPDVIGPIIMPAIPEPSGTLAMGDYLPPRRKWVNYWLVQMGTLGELMENETKEMAFPEGKMQTIAPLWIEIKTLVQDINFNYLKLVQLVERPTLSRDAIGILTMNIYDDTTKFEKPWKELVKTLRDKK
jgi:hypothetical protein